MPMLIVDSRLFKLSAIESPPIRPFHGVSDEGSEISRRWEGFSNLTSIELPVTEEVCLGIFKAASGHNVPESKVIDGS